MEQGLISIRNEDGTQWLGSGGMWATLRRGGRPFNRSHFEKLKSEAPATMARNSPDNGYFGYMNLTWHPLTDEQAAEQNQKADQFDAEMVEQARAEDEELDRIYGGQE